MKVTVFILFNLIVNLSLAQSMENINHKAIGKKVFIEYDLLGLDEEQYLEVSVYCSDDQFQDPLQSLSGKGYETPVIGNGKKVIIWDPLYDRNELVGDSIQFEIKAIIYEKKNKQPITRGLTKDFVYEGLSADFTHFINEARDLKDAFESALPHAFSNGSATAIIKQKIENYSAAYERLNRERLAYENNTASLWNEKVSKDIQYLYDYVLGDIHRVNILQLNKLIVRVNNYHFGSLKAKEKRQEKKNILFRLEFHVNQLKEQLDELDKRVNRVLYNLMNEN